MAFQNPKGNQDRRDIIIINTKSSIDSSATANRAILLPDKNGTLLTTGDTFNPQSVVYATSGTFTYTIPVGATFIRFIATGGGGGGGAGSRFASGNDKGGGGGGSGGSVSDITYRVIDILGAVLDISIALGGVGATSVSIDSTVGSNGGGGGVTTVSENSTGRLLIRAAGGNGGGGGTAAAGGAGGAINTQGATYLGSVGCSGGRTAVGSYSGNPSNMAASGGGGGSGISSTNVVCDAVNGAGGSRSYTSTVISTLPGARGVSSDINGKTPIFDYSSYPGGGGGGGGFSRISDNSGNGGDGSFPGGGGGGGGASNDGFLSGAGGKGGDGKLLILVW